MVSTWIKKTKTKDISFSTQKIFIFFGHVEQSFGKFVKRDCKSCRKMLDIEDMKKFIILAIVLVFVFGGGIGIYIGFTKQNKDNFNAESENKSKEIEKFVEVEDPFVLAKEKLTLVLCDKTANVCASVYNADNTNLKFSEFDNNIIEIDSLGNVKPLQVGETSIKSFVEIGDKEYSYTTKVVVLPLEIEAEINLVDENENSVTNPLLGEKYTLKLTSVNLKFYDLSLIASDHVKVSNDKTLDNCRSCDVYFESKTEHSLQFKLVLNADNMKHTLLLDKLVVDNSEKSQMFQKMTIQNQATQMNQPIQIFQMTLKTIMLILPTTKATITQLMTIQLKIILLTTIQPMTTQLKTIRLNPQREFLH